MIDLNVIKEELIEIICEDWEEEYIVEMVLRELNINFIQNSKVLTIDYGDFLLFDGGFQCYQLGYNHAVESVLHKA